MSTSRRYLDPVDGTKRFIADDPMWMTLIAAHDEQVVLGIVDLPALGERWWAARSHGAFHDSQPIGTSARARLAEAVVNDTWCEDLARGNQDHRLSAIADPRITACPRSPTVAPKSVRTKVTAS